MVGWLAGPALRAGAGVCRYCGRVLGFFGVAGQGAALAHCGSPEGGALWCRADGEPCASSESARRNAGQGAAVAPCGSPEGGALWRVASYGFAWIAARCHDVDSSRWFAGHGRFVFCKRLDHGLCFDPVTHPLCCGFALFLDFFGAGF